MHHLTPENQLKRIKNMMISPIVYGLAIKKAVSDMKSDKVWHLLGSSGLFVSLLCVTMIFSYFVCVRSRFDKVAG